MPPTDSPAVIVARFLRANHYTETFDAFIKEAGLDDNAGTTNPGDWSLERILEEKVQYDQSLNFERKGNDGNQGWTSPAPSVPNLPADIGTTSNILSVSGSPSGESIHVTSADRRWQELSASLPYKVLRSEYNDGSPILSTVALSSELTVSTSMSGELILRYTPSWKILDKRRDHSKYAVQVAAHQWYEDEWLIASAGWDAKICIYRTDIGVVSDPTLEASLGFPIHTIELQTNPESMLFVLHPDNGQLYLVISRRDSTHLHYYEILSTASGAEQTDRADTPKVFEAGRQNLAPHSNAWVAFTPSCLAQHPMDKSLIAVATSHLPHMKLLIVRLLFPRATTGNLDDNNNGLPPTQASQARAALAVQDREDTAIRLQVSTMAPQTPYSTPQVVWRPNGSGVWVNGDDGIVRGIEVQTGKVITLLKGHEAGTKVRTLWAGQVLTRERTASGEDDLDHEVVVSGGFDKKVLIWTPESAEH